MADVGGGIDPPLVTLVIEEKRDDKDQFLISLNVLNFGKPINQFGGFRKQVHIDGRDVIRST